MLAIHEIFKQKFRNRSFWGKKIMPKNAYSRLLSGLGVQIGPGGVFSNTSLLSAAYYYNICYFATKVRTWFEMDLNQWKILVFHTLLFLQQNYTVKAKMFTVSA